MILRWILTAAFIAAIMQTANAAETFSCEGRASGYYADVDTGCRVYHMCDGLGRQFSYSCPNTTLFQQRMLICDHWYMVNCSHAELDYGANLLIGQKDKPFVEDSSEHPYHRTPRPDLLEQPYAPDYPDDDYRQGKAQSHSSAVRNLVGVATEEVEEDEFGNPLGNYTTDGPQYFLPSHWSTHYDKSLTTPIPLKANKDIKGGKTGRPFVKNPTFGDGKLPPPNTSFDPKHFKVTKPLVPLVSPPLPTATFNNAPEQKISPTKFTRVPASNVPHISDTLLPPLPTATFDSISKPKATPQKNPVIAPTSANTPDTSRPINANRRTVPNPTLSAVITTNNQRLSTTSADFKNTPGLTSSDGTNFKTSRPINTENSRRVFAGAQNSTPRNLLPLSAPNQGATSLNPTLNSGTSIFNSRNRHTDNTRQGISSSFTGSSLSPSSLSTPLSSTFVTNNQANTKPTTSTFIPRSNGATGSNVQIRKLGTTPQINIVTNEHSIPDSANEASASPSSLALPPFLPKLDATTSKPTSDENDIPDISPPSIYYEPPKLSQTINLESTTMDPETFYKLVPSKELLPPVLRRTFEVPKRQGSKPFGSADEQKSARTEGETSSFQPRPFEVSRNRSQNVEPNLRKESPNLQNGGSFSTLIPSSDGTTNRKTVGKKDTANDERAEVNTEESVDVSSDRRWKELRQMFFIPEYDFPLEVGSRPSYESGLSSFQVNSAPPFPISAPPVMRFKDRAPQGPNPDCPKCDPAFLAPGTCKPCVMIRR